MSGADTAGSGTAFAEPVEVEVDRRVWNLEISLDSLTGAAAAWQECARRAGVNLDDMSGTERGQLDELMPRLRSMSNLSNQVAKELELAASQLRQRQRWLDDMLTDLMALVPARDRRLDPELAGPTVVSRSTRDTGYPSHVVFQANSFQDLRLIEEAKSNAKRVRQRANETVDGVRSSLDTVTRQLHQLGDSITVS